MNTCVPGSRRVGAASMILDSPGFTSIGKPRNSEAVEEQMSRVLHCSLAAVTALMMASAASAHHSHAMFDTDKQVTLVGTVKEFEWNNPHCWIQVLVPDPKNPKAPPVEW